METKDKGIAELYKRANARATATRDSTKGRLKKFGLYAAVVLVVLTLLIWWKNTPLKEEVAKAGVEKSVPAMPNTSAQWKQSAEDGSIPVGVWSESTMLPPGSKTFFDAGNGTVYQIRYRLYKSEWTVHSGGNNFPPADEIQFKAMKPGLQKIPFTVKQP